MATINALSVRRVLIKQHLTVLLRASKAKTSVQSRGVSPSALSDSHSDARRFDPEVTVRIDHNGKGAATGEGQNAPLTTVDARRGRGDQHLFPRGYDKEYWGSSRTGRKRRSHLLYSSRR